LTNKFKDLSFKTLFDAAADAMLLVDSIGQVIDANPSALQLLEYTETTIRGITVEELMPARFRGQHHHYRDTFYKKPSKRSMGNGIDLFALSSSGKELAVDISLSPIEAQGQIYNLITFYSADKRREMEQALRISEERRQLSNHAANLGIFERSLTSGALYLDEKALELLGTEPEGDLGDEKLLLKIIPEDCASTQAALDRALDPNGDGRYHAEYRIIRPIDGIERHLNAVGKVHFEGGRATRLMGILQDITEHKQTRDILKKSRDQLTIFIQQAPISVAMLDQNMNYITYSTRWLTQFGRGYDNLVGRNHYAVHPDLPVEWKVVHQQVLAGATWENNDDKWTQNDGSIYWLRWSSIPWFDENSKVGGIIITAEDITAQKMLDKQFQEQRIEAESLLKQQVAANTASAIAHELNQPLAAISAYSEVAIHLLSEKKINPEKLKRALEGCAAQAQRAGTSLHELMAFLQHGDLVIDTFDLNDLIKDALKITKEDGYSDFHPSLQLEQHMPAVRANKTHVQKVMVNLLKNGIEAMRGSGVSNAEITIIVRTNTDMNMAHVTVQDKGPGISQDKVKQIFDPFFTTKPTGIGMGLAISRALIEANGGQLWLQPNNKPGATFHFTLPF
jgi:PAS domain S-box-containing protein